MDKVLYCLRINWRKVLSPMKLCEQVEMLRSKLNDDRYHKRFAYCGDDLVCFHVGEFVDGDYICTFYCWNFFFDKYSNEKYRTMSKHFLLTQTKKDFPDFENFIIPVLIDRKRQLSYKRFLRKFFKDCREYDFQLPKYPDHQFLMVKYSREVPF